MSNGPKKLNLIECATLAIGGMIGSAIFALSGLSYSLAGPAVILSWIIGGVILLCYGLMTAELVTIYPNATGGMFEYPYETMGKSETGKKGWGWFAAWSLLNVNIFGAGFSAIYIAQYLSQIFPQIDPNNTTHIIILAVIASVLFGVLCLFNVSIAGKLNLAMVLGIIVCLVIFMALCFSNGAFSGANFSPFFSGGFAGDTGFITAIPIAMLAYGAIVTTAFMTSQVQNPKKNVPSSMRIAMIVCIALYVLTIVAIIGMWNIQMFYDEANAWAQYAIPFAVCAYFLYNVPWLSYVVAIAAVLALASTMLVLMMMAGWQIQAAASKGLLPKGLAKVSPKTNTPIRAMILVTIATVILSCFPGLVTEITNCGGICNAIGIVVIAITLLNARRKPGYEKKSSDFRLAGGPVIPVLVIILVCIFILPVVFQQLTYWLWAIVWYAIGAVIFFLCLGLNKGKA